MGRVSRFHGLFVGIDRYPPPVTRLSCAVADATALAALFEDNFGGTVSTLFDEDATRDRVIEKLRYLSEVAEDDLVVVAFSGHGTPDHEIVPFDVKRR